MDANQLRVLIVSDDLLARTGLATLLDNQTDCDVVGQTTGGAQLLAELDVYQPDTVLYDLGWTPKTTLPHVLRLVDSDVALVVLLGDVDAATDIIPALATFGTYGLLLRDTDAATMALALNTVSNGLIVIDPALVDALAPPNNIMAEPIDAPLTPREDEVLQLLAQGMTNKAIAQALGITDHTVKFHVNALMTKLGAQSRTEAVVRATRAGLILL